MSLFVSQKIRFLNKFRKCFIVNIYILSCLTHNHLEERWDVNLKMKIVILTLMYVVLNLYRVVLNSVEHKMSALIRKYQEIKSEIFEHKTNLSLIRV